METAWCGAHPHPKTVRPIVGIRLGASQKVPYTEAWQVSVVLDCGERVHVVTTAVRKAQMEWQSKLCSRLAKRGAA